MLLKKIANHELFRGSAIYLLASAMNAAIPLLLLPVLTRYLSPAEYGEVAMFLVWVSLIGALCGLSVHGAANRKYFDIDENADELAKYIFMCFSILMVSSLIMLGIVVILGPYLSKMLNISYVWLIIGVPVAALGFINKLRLGQWQVSKQAARYGVHQVSQSLANVSLTLFFVVVLYLGASGRILAISSTFFVFAIISILTLFKDRLIKFAWRPDMAKEALNFGVPLIPHIVGMFLLNTVDRVVITSELGLDQAGIYMVAIQLSMAAGIILDAVNKSFVPWLYERLKRNEINEKLMIVKATYAYYCLLGFGAFLGFIVAGDVLLLIVGRDYSDAANLIGWVILAKAFHGGYLMVTNYLFYSKNTGVLSTITIFCGLLNVALLFVLIGYAGLIGAAWAYCISKFVQWIVTWLVASRMVSMPWFKIFAIQK
ncbi:polysaccharide biosynthesis protein [Aliidiomarina sedimenti]|uniref:Polysaccharide biosynthesis protein n=1 Tax=Aliidiomarina sedimenti TaxID=1933879 RepID=A0ABY0BZP1_9GAMM|nr:oligosaccharide flippase family protein [Aliidiomarina sedimenti]RUO30002.1 polysaccharide biosynthesis protein [Aliidiomarina sedimenti]